MRGGQDSSSGLDGASIAIIVIISILVLVLIVTLIVQSVNRPPRCPLPPNPRYYQRGDKTKAEKKNRSDKSRNEQKKTSQPMRSALKKSNLRGSGQRSMSSKLKFGGRGLDPDYGKAKYNFAKKSSLSPPYGCQPVEEPSEPLAQMDLRGKSGMKHASLSYDHRIGEYSGKTARGEGFANLNSYNSEKYRGAASNDPDERSLKDYLPDMSCDPEDNSGTQPSFNVDSLVMAHRLGGKAKGSFLAPIRDPLSGYSSHIGRMSDRGTKALMKNLDSRRQEFWKSQKSCSDPDATMMFAIPEFLTW